MLVVAVDDGRGHHLGEGMCPTVGSACCERDLVLVEDGGAGDVDKGVRLALLEVLVVNVEAEVGPRVVLDALCDGFAVVMHDEMCLNG